ncbi:hypothetical protein WMY93_029367 [Mugilogobius chulae]|uniref:Alpha-2-macroglobulin-like protein 1 n=1 Tax=Mugilogobius chulae TaxID=88201 RepID=A0AAW0MR31_9GOBI
MCCSSFQTWSWALVFSLSWICAAGEPVYMVTFPAVLEAGATAKLCASLLQPNETITVTVTLTSDTDRNVLFQHTSKGEFHICSQFKAPAVMNWVVQQIHVEARGLTFYSTQVTKVQITVSSPTPLTIIQTDKPFYLPGQTVHFRAFTLDTKFKPINAVDRDGHRIGQWLNMSSNYKLIQLSYPLNSEAVEGKYKITVETKHKRTERTITVEKYVLPKFSIQLISPSELSDGETNYEFQVCGKYTFGQAVQGAAEVELCQHPFAYRYGFPPDVRILTSRCFTLTNQTGKDGCAPFSFEMSLFTNDSIGMKKEIYMKAKFKEQGTGIVRKQETTIKHSYAIGWVSFIEAPSRFKRGQVIIIKVKVVSFRNNPVPDTMVFLSRKYLYHKETLQSLQTDSDGIVTFMLNTTHLRGNLELWASLESDFRMVYFHPHYSPAVLELIDIENPHWQHQTESALEVSLGKTDKYLSCGAEEEFFIKYTLMGEPKGVLQVMYLAVSKGEILKHGHYTTEVQSYSVFEGVVPFTLDVTAEMAPVVEIVAYAILPSKKVIATSSPFGTELCFSSKVSVEFSPRSAVPGEDVGVQVQAPPHSLCALRVIDQSVLLKDSDARMSPAKMFFMLPALESSPFSNTIDDNQECRSVRKKRSQILADFKEKDVYTIFKNHGLKMATNLWIPMASCPNPDDDSSLRLPPYTRSSYENTNHPPAPVQTKRDLFPETWIWDLVDTGETGSNVLHVSAPDIITTWETETFCLSSEGFGLAPRKELTVFQPFFLDFTLPFSIIRGERFELKATVFNFLTSCMMITVEVISSQNFSLTSIPEDKSCLCANDRKTFSWTVVPSALGVVNVTVRAEAVSADGSCDNEIVTVPDRGHIDVVTKTLTVEMEGTKMTKNHNWLLCPKGQTLTVEVSLQLPDNVIAGSVYGSVSVVGDMLGRALKNLDGTLQMPYGCGEQNMALLAQDIYIVHYLENTQQLTAAVMDRARHFMISAYQRQLKYLHSEGSYSTFETGQGHTWLTAFVLRSFAKARSYVFIDPLKIEQAAQWLMGKQKTNGCFERKGKLFNNRMKGGVSDEVTLSAYISAAFLETNISATHLVMNNSLSCLRNSISDLSNTYTTALLAYVFTLAQDMETRALLLDRLDKVAHEEDGSLHWSQTDTGSSDSLSVEISSYVLLAKLSASSPSVDDLNYCYKIVQWLIGQQNQYGGFRSTQDTVVALQALALYSRLTYSAEGRSSVLVQTLSAQMRFEVTQDNRLLYQEKTLPDVTGQYNVEVQGSACVSLQFSLHYNIPTPTSGTSLRLEITTEINCQSIEPELNLKLTSVFSGEEDFSNMLILDIKVLSGFASDPESLKVLENGPQVDRIDKNDDHILLYLRSMRKDKLVVHHLKLTQKMIVQNLKPAVVKIYDYYQPSNQAEAEYSYQC